MRLFMRYQSAVQREYDKAVKEFKLAKAEREELLWFLCQELGLRFLEL